LEINIRIPHPAAFFRPAALLILALAFALFASRDGVHSAGANSITTPDTLGGLLTSVALDESGFPVVSYNMGVGLRVMHCNDANCAGGDESIEDIEALPAPSILSFATSLVLDASGFPVVAYYNSAMTDLRVLHCNDVNCAGGDESITSPETTASFYPSLALDASGFPVVSYHDSGAGDLEILHCNDVDCAGGDESITAPDSGGDVGEWTSLELDVADRPVISYFDVTNANLKVMHCNDVDCAGGGESIMSPDTGGDVGLSTSLTLDFAATPVVSYYDTTNDDLKVLNCNDVNCDPAVPGAPDSITSPDTAGDVGLSTAIALGVAGFPVVSYRDTTNTDLKVMHCNDVNCAGGGETITSPDGADDVGTFDSLALDDSGFPVVSYFDGTNTALKVLHCLTPGCTNNPGTQEVLIASLTAGWPVGPMRGACYEFDDVVMLDTFVVCDNETGSGVDTAPACGKGGDAMDLCTDDDPAIGSIRVALFDGTYDVTTSSAPGHRPDPHLKSCDPTPGVDAKCRFEHVPLTRPWFPWDVNGDGAVASADFNQVIQRFGQTK
jgi:hypothetical protein